MYQREPHARQMSFKDIAQPTTYEERCRLARRTRSELSLTGTLLVDAMDDTSRAFFGDLPTPAIIIGPDGHVKVKLPWAEPAVIGPRLEKVLAEKRSKATTPRERLIDAMIAFHGGRAEEASSALAAMTRTWKGPAALRPLALRALAACHAKQGRDAKSACDAAEQAARRVLEGDRLKAALAEIAAIRKR